MDDPLFLPGDQKTFTHHGADHPRIIALCFFVLMIGVVIVGISCFYVSEWAAGMILTVVGLGVISVMLKARLSEAQMASRMGKRTNPEESNAPKIT